MGDTLVVGVGGAGGSMAEHIGPALGADVLKVNYSDAFRGDRVSEPRAYRRLDLGRRPARTAATEAEAAAESVAGAFTERLAGYSHVVLLAGLGGATGSGAASALAGYAGTHGARVTAMVTLPFSFEEKRIPIAQAALARLRPKVDRLILHDHARCANAAGKAGTSLADYLDGVGRDCAATLSNVLKEFA